MKKQSYLIMLTLCVFSTALFARNTVSQGAIHQTSKTTGADEVINPSVTVVNINNMAYWIAKDGAGTTQGSPNGQQADYPIFTGGFIYEDGMLWGVKSNEYSESEPVRVGGSTYAQGMKAGNVRYDAAGNVIGSDDPTNHHAWRVRTDWATADLTRDASNFYGYTSPTAASAEEVQNVKDQYESDWNNWRADLGAPYDDVDNNGSYDPAVDVPGYPGADQTVWTISNDVPTIVDANGDSIQYSNTSESLYGADPVGIEMQLTMWAYAYGASDPLGNSIFKKASITYTGLKASSPIVNPTVLDSVYFTQWSDPDLGTYTDDYVGCDIDLSFGYVYNGNRLDGVFNGVYNLACPAGGYDFLQGPVDNRDIDGDGDSTEYLPMTSFAYFGAGSSISDPDFSYAGSLQWYNLMEAFLPRPEYPVQIPFTDPTTGEATMFALSGDPVTGSGWVDGVILPPGDRRQVMTSGPFKMTKGETADVVLGIAAGIGLDAVSSVSVAKYVDTYAQYAYDQNFSLPSAPTAPSLMATEMDGEIKLDWGSNAAAVSSTEETVSAGFEFEGYNVYQLPSAGAPLSEGRKIGTYDKVNTVQNILDPDVDALTGLVVDVVKQTGTNAGVQRFYSTDYDEIRGRPMSNGVAYYFAVTAYSYLAANEGSPFKTLESGEARVTVQPHDANPGVTAYNDVTVTHDGTANASVEVNILNTDYLKDETYEVNFDQQHYYRDLAGVWQHASTDSTPRIAGKTVDCSPSTVSASAIASANVGTIDLILTFDLVCPGGAWIDGVQFEFPEGFASNVNSWAITGGGNVCSYGSGSGQNCENLDGSWAGDVLLFGTEATGGGFGAFESSNVFTVNVNPWFAGDLEALAVGYTVWDDGYDGTTVNGEGTSTIAELGFEFKTETHWNLSTASGTSLLTDQTFVNGSDLYGGSSVDNESGLHYNSTAAVTVDGFQVNVNGGYDAPNDFYGLDYELNEEVAATDGDAIYDWDSYAANGWALTARATDTWGAGISSVDILQRDIQIRFTGDVVDEPTTTAAGVVYYPAKEGEGSGGSYAWIDGARVGGLENHPDPANPGDGTYFRIKIPFEVWDMEAEGGPAQIDITIYDRLQSYASGDTVYSFNYYNRMYTHFIHLPYKEDGDYADIDNNLTWNVVWWDTQFNQGDVVTIQYANPIQTGVDKFSFTMKATDVDASNVVEDVNVYPNPYYGFHELEASRTNKFVSFNHLPQTATIKIYSLGGTLVRTIDKADDGTQFIEWNLKNQYGYPVASGLYIVRIESGGNEKVLKLALVQETQVLKYY
jgi:hypothetical protein